jgi:hypothetical protein
MKTISVRYLLFTIHRLPFMYRKPRFLEELHAIREEMSREADYDVELFAEMVRSGLPPRHGPERNIRGFRSRAPRADEGAAKPAPKKRAAG